MDAGQFNRRITIQRRVTTVNENGMEIETWTDSYLCWAYVNGISGTEFWSAQAVQAEQTVVFTVRYCRFMKELDTMDFRILFDGKPYDIKNIDNVRYGNDVVKIRAIAHSMEVANDEV
jgi:SPP1 family predicted phage head-tail adaptor